MADTISFTLHEITQQLGGLVVGDASVRISQVATLAQAEAGQISFLTNSKYRNLLSATRATAVVVGPKDRDQTEIPRIVADNPYAYVARLLALLNPVAPAIHGIHPHAVVSEHAQVDQSASVGPHAVVEAGAKIGARCVIGPGCYIGNSVEIGEDARVYPNVTIYHGCTIGHRAIIHSGVVIGADGFGFAPDAGVWVKIPQIGGVVIGNDVEIGANTTIDRGALDDTVIEDGVKLDNQIQIAHNVHIGAHTVMAACVGVAGSTSIGKHCMVGGAAGIIGHLSIADRTTISVGTFVTKSITEPGTYTAVLSAEPHRDWLKANARMRHLDEMADRIRSLEQKIEELKKEKP